jgi:hypothetical protein
MRATGQTAILVAILLLLPACTSPLDIPKDPSTVQAYKRLRVAVVEPAPTGDRFNAGIVEDTTRTFVTYFGSVTIAKSVEEARASNPDLIATLSIDTDPSTHIFSNSRIDVHVRFASSDPRDNRILEELHAHGSQYPRPFLLPTEVNEAARERFREQMQAAILGAAKLAAFAKAPRSIAKGSAKPGSAMIVHSDIDTPAYKLREIPDNYALVVGIEQYAGLPDAQFAARDADTVRAHLVALGYPDRNVIYLTGQNATRAGIQKYLSEWLPRNVKPSSTVFFYYSGHGAPDTKTGEAYLVPWDGDPQFLATTAYPLKEVYAALEKLPARDVTVVLDSCFSGAGGRSVLAAGLRPMVITVESGFLPQGRLALLAAASRDEVTGGLDEQGHGIFTYYFLKGLSGAAKNASGAVTLKGLFEYVKPLVQDAARRQNRDQTPVLYGLQQDHPIIRFD